MSLPGRGVQDGEDLIGLIVVWPLRGGRWMRPHHIVDVDPGNVGRQRGPLAIMHTGELIPVRELRVVGSLKEVGQAARLGLLHGVKEAVQTPTHGPKRPMSTGPLPRGVTLSGAVVEVSKADVWPIVSKAFPDYRGGKFKVEVSPTVTLYDTNWGGGTRNSGA